MGPSVKFVLRTNGSFSKKKIRSNFFYSEKRPNEGGFGKRPDFLLDFWQPSLLSEYKAGHVLRLSFKN